MNLQDTTGDGRYDTLKKDMTGDGKIDTILQDTTGDGKYDTGRRVDDFDADRPLSLGR